MERRNGGTYSPFLSFSARCAAKAWLQCTIACLTDWYSTPRAYLATSTAHTSFANVKMSIGLEFIVGSATRIFASIVRRPALVCWTPVCCEAALGNRKESKQRFTSHVFKPPLNLAKYSGRSGTLSSVMGAIGGCVKTRMFGKSGMSAILISAIVCREGRQCCSRREVLKSAVPWTSSVMFSKRRELTTNWCTGSYSYGLALVRLGDHMQGFPDTEGVCADSLTFSKRRSRVI